MHVSMLQERVEDAALRRPAPAFVQPQAPRTLFWTPWRWAAACPCSPPSLPTPLSAKCVSAGQLAGMLAGPGGCSLASAVLCAVLRMRYISLAGASGAHAAVHAMHVCSSPQRAMQSPAAHGRCMLTMLPTLSTL